MLLYTDKDIKDILTTIITDVEFTIIPVGNHDIGRHLVYKVVIEDESRYIFKIYYILSRKHFELILELAIASNYSLIVILFLSVILDSDNCPVLKICKK